ncbi:hypothetical protein [Serratia marcescens]|uniref:hypothetical protein n=1 Tax=Serratia marcescens TaxID=615 RepID=UPI0014042747|nr:hypothetical protein [Serratia marcescens]
MGALILQDSFVFIAFLTMGVLYILRVGKKYGFGLYAKSFLILYAICSYSSYNIMVKPIHDYNLSVPRTFIYHFKLVGPLAPVDVIFLGLLFVITLKKLSGKTLLLYKIDSVASIFVKYILLQALFLGTISTIGFFSYMKNGGVGALNDQLIIFRGVIYFFVLIYFFQKAIADFKHMGFINVLLMFCIIDFINFSSGFIASFIYHDYVWQRYGVRITIIDQDKIYNCFTMYALLVTSYLFLKPLKKLSVYFTIMIVGIFMFLNMYKFLFMIAVLYIIYEFIINAFRGKIAIIKFSIIVTAGIALVSVILMLSTSKAMNTRSSQLSDYWEYTGSSFPASVFGIGYGGKFYSPSDTDDMGEVKEVDLQSGVANYRKNVQTPLITNIKTGGTLGLGVAIGFAFFALLYVMRLNIKMPINALSNAICFNIIWLMASTSVLLQAYIMPVMTMIKLLILLSVFLGTEEVKKFNLMKN